jgi:hypothetical protein
MSTSPDMARGLEFERFIKEILERSPAIDTVPASNALRNDTQRDFYGYPFGLKVYADRNNI